MENIQISIFMNKEYGQITNVSTDFYIKQFIHKQVYKIYVYVHYEVHY